MYYPKKNEFVYASNSMTGPWHIAKFVNMNLYNFYYPFSVYIAKDNSNIVLTDVCFIRPIIKINRGAFMYKIGDRVKITYGKFAGLTGSIVEQFFDENAYRVKFDNSDDAGFWLLESYFIPEKTEESKSVKESFKIGDIVTDITDKEHNKLVYLNECNSVTVICWIIEKRCISFYKIENLKKE